MDTLFFTKLLGIYMLVGGIALFTNKKMIEDWVQNVSKEPGFRMMGGMIALLFGLVIVLNHNMWTDFQTGFVSFFGWVAILKGVFIMIFPPFYEKAAGFVKGKIQIAGILWLVIGAYLTYIGFLT